MAPLSDAEQATVATDILTTLAHTQYACSRLSKLSGGTVNFVFCGNLIEPIFIHNKSGTSNLDTIIVKHFTGFLSCNRDFPVEASRSKIETLMLDALTAFAPTLVEGPVVVKTPKLLFSDRDARTQVHEYITNAADLRAILKPTSSSEPARLTSIGSTVGRWLRDFHAWTSKPSQADLRTQLLQNEAMRQLKYRVTYGIVIGVLENFPEILNQHRDTLEAVILRSKKEFDQSPHDHHVKGWGIIHGDFWTGNILLSHPSHEGSLHESLYAIDWEYTHHGHRAHDLGQMIGDLYERKHFTGFESATILMSSFIDGYGPIDDDIAFRTAIHVGAHLIGWYTRRAPNSPLGAPLEKVQDLLHIATEFIVRGWKEDREWFRNSDLSSLFKNN